MTKKKKRVKVEVLVQKKIEDKVTKNIEIVLKKAQISKYKVIFLNFNLPSKKKSQKIDKTAKFIIDIEPKPKLISKVNSLFKN